MCYTKLSLDLVIIIPLRGGKKVLIKKKWGGGGGGGEESHSVAFRTGMKKFKKQIPAKQKYRYLIEHLNHPGPYSVMRD